MYVLKGDIVNIRGCDKTSGGLSYAPMTDVVMAQDVQLDSWEKVEVTITSGRSVFVYPWSIEPREIRWDADDLAIEDNFTDKYTETTVSDPHDYEGECCDD